MTSPLISVCIPAYNRAEFLSPLLDSIISQDATNFEILVAEDKSPQRDEIASIIQHYKSSSAVSIRAIFNSKNLGYDANIRNLIHHSAGRFCFFMGNDDIMAPSALKTVEHILLAEPNIGVLLKSYAIFSDSPTKPDYVIRYFKTDRKFPSGISAMSVGIRRSGVISGFVIDRAIAKKVETTKYDGGLYYQIYLASQALALKSLYYTRQLLVYSRSTESPDFGNADCEKDVFTVGKYTSSARVKMLSSALQIVRDVCKEHGLQNSAWRIERDYATYLYPFISDQLDLSPIKYVDFYFQMALTGLWRYPLFHLNMICFYFLRSRFSSRLVRSARAFLRS